MAILSMVVTLAPLIMGIGYAIWPSESRLALMRPLSLAGVFSSLTGFALGLINSLVCTSVTVPQARSGLDVRTGGVGFVTLAVGFGCLTVGWLCVALGMRRQDS